MLHPVKEQLDRVELIVGKCNSTRLSLDEWKLECCSEIGLMVRRGRHGGDKIRRRTQGEK